MATARFRTPQPSPRLRAKGRSDLAEYPSSLELRIQGITEPVAHQVEGEHGDENGETGIRNDPRCALDEFERGRKHRSPLRRRWLRAEAEKAECRGIENRRGEAQRRLDDQRRDAI